MTDSTLSTTSARVIPQPWLSSAKFDIVAVIAPAFVSSLLVLIFRQQLTDSPTLPLWAWVSIVLMVDVAHVYATLFRTYLSPRALHRNATLLIAIPISCWGVGCLLYSINGLLFWRVLAYLAVFHFIRQQYGFTAIYSRKDPPEVRKYGWIDRLVVYSATIYPLLFWHTHLPRKFDWFIEGDFISGLPEVASALGFAVYVAAATIYISKELWVFKSSGFFNVPKNLLIVGTALSWWVGIITVNSDFAFTLTNVLSHGIPYMGLIWLYQRPTERKESPLSTESCAEKPTALENKLTACTTFILSSLPIFVAFLILLAYLEEGFWDGFVWREHSQLFNAFWHLPAIIDPTILAFLIPLLALPQSTHYVLDGFIWRVKDRSSIWST